MGYSVISIPFFTDEITIIPHTATRVEHLDRPVSVREFSQGKPMRLLLNEDNNEYTFELLDGSFVTGEEE